MSNRWQIAVLGMGRFGTALAKELNLLGHEVLAIDSNEKTIQDVVAGVSHAVQADVTDEDALRDLGLQDFDAAIVAISSRLETSILATMLMKHLGVRRVLAKASSALHASILTRIGADRVVFPEQEAGLRLAHSLMAPAVRDYLDVAPGYGIVRMATTGLTGKSLSELDPGLGVTVLALLREQSIIQTPHRSEILRMGDELIVAGLDEDLARMPVSNKELQ